MKASDIKPGERIPETDWEAIAPQSHKGRTHWDCKCLNCGTEHRVRLDNLLTGNSTQCKACAEQEAEQIKPGDRFPRDRQDGWEVIEFAKTNAQRQKYWRCKCLRCDRDHYEVRASSLRDGSSKCCRSCASKNPKC